jgi:HEPN domain-containing protein
VSSAEDLRGATLLSRADNRNAIYFCSQAAEKVIRAVLTSEGKYGGINHKLDMMVDMISDDNRLPLVSGRSASHSVFS